MAVNTVWGMLNPQERKEVLEGAHVLDIMDKPAKSYCSFLFLNYELNCGVIGYSLPESHEIHIPDHALVVELNNSSCVDQVW